MMNHIKDAYVMTVLVLLVSQLAALSQVPLPDQKGIPGASEAWGKRLSLLEPYHNEAKVGRAKGDWVAVEAVCLKAVSQVEADPMSWLWLAEASERLGKQAQELRAYRELVYPVGWGSSVGSDVTTRMKYVLALARANRWQEACVVYHKAVADTVRIDGSPIVEETFTPARREFARLQAAAHLALGLSTPTFEQDDPPDRLRHLEAAVKLQPNMARAQYEYGQALEKAGRKEEADGAYRMSVKYATGDLKAKVEAAITRVGWALHPKTGPAH